MTWISLDTNMTANPKILKLLDLCGPAGPWIYIQSLCYAGEQLTDGAIPRWALPQLIGATEEIAGLLVDVELWESTPTGWQIHDYLEKQRSKEQVLAERASWAERARRHRQRKKADTPSRRDVTRDSPDTSQIPSSGGSERHAVTDTVSGEVITPSERHAVTDREDPDTSDSVTPLVTRDKGVTSRVSHADRGEESREEIKTTPTPSPASPARLPRDRGALAAVERISAKLTAGRADGANAWNLSKLVGAEWDQLDETQQLGSMIALLGWYVEELQSRQLESREFGRIGQLVKRYGRIALLAVDEAAIKDLDDLISYAHRVAQTMHAERSPA